LPIRIVKIDRFGIQRCGAGTVTPSFRSVAS
jgi:hypothetical protein